MQKLNPLGTMMPRFPTAQTPLMPVMMPQFNPLMANPLGLTNSPGVFPQPNSLLSPFQNPLLQPQNNFPLQKLGENDKNNSGFPTVMIPGIGPCMMIPTALAEGLVKIE